jgi:peroxiredoxin
VVWAVANDDPQKLREFRDAEAPDLTFLVDPVADTIRRYGIFNDGDGRGLEIPHPATLVIDKEGVIRYLRIDEDYRQRPPVDDLLEVLRNL